MLPHVADSGVIQLSCTCKLFYVLRLAKTLFNTIHFYTTLYYRVGSSESTGMQGELTQIFKFYFSRWCCRSRLLVLEQVNQRPERYYSLRKEWRIIRPCRADRREPIFQIMSLRLHGRYLEVISAYSKQCHPNTAVQTCTVLDGPRLCSTPAKGWRQVALFFTMRDVHRAEPFWLKIHKNIWIPAEAGI